MQYSAYRFIAKCTTINADLHGVWNFCMECGTCHKFTLGFIISFQSFIKQWIICTSPYNSDYASTTCIDLCKCDDNLIDRKSFWTLDFNWETFMQPTWAKYLGQRRKELFPFTLNNSCPLDWHWLILVSEIKNSNMSYGEMISKKQFSQCLILYTSTI